jgi:hypothetical protein
MNGVFLTQNTLVPTGEVLSFVSAEEVSAFFGPASEEYALAQIYFLGYDNSTIKPGTIIFAPFNLTARAAWVQGGSLEGMTLTQLQALSGSLSVVMDGYTHTASSINLSTATSFSDAANKIATALDASEPTEATGTGSISGSVMTITSLSTGTFEPGQTVTGSSVTAGSIITAQLTSTEPGSTNGGTGTYQLAASSTVGSGATLTASATAISVTWNSIQAAFVISSGITGTESTVAYPSGTIAAGLNLTSATGAILSQGAALDTPTTAMANVVENTQNWVSFTTIWEPVIADKENFAVWVNAQNQRYCYICWDTDAQAIVEGATTCFGAVANANAYDCVVPVYNTVNLAAFVLGAIASINFSETNGRITTAFKSQSGMAPTVTDAQVAANLLANGYSFYGSYATANNGFVFFYNSHMSGKWLWLDTFVDQVYLNSQLQLALMELLTSVGAIPYNQKGYTLVRAAMLDPINQMLNFGGIQTGINLSLSQKSQLAYQAGQDVSNIVENTGYYMQVLDPGAQVRGNRGTPVINLWYTDGGSVQQISLASIDII